MPGWEIDKMTIAIRKVILPREHQKVAGGQTIQAEIEVVAGDIAPILTDPTEVPVFSLFDPVGSSLLTDVTMTKVSTGRYKRLYQTLANSTIGLYTASFTVTHFTESARLEKVGLFLISRTSTLATFSYLAIKDQNGVVWYWYIALDNTLSAPNPAIPSALGKQAISVTPAVVPSWLEINNPTPSLRYVFPALTGEATVSATQPSVGSGNVGSPTFVGLSNGSFKIALNVSDTIILATV